MAGGVDTETVDTHLDEAGVAFHQVIGHAGILGVEVNAVTCNLSPPAGGIVPVKPSLVVVEVVDILVGEVGVLHQRQAGAILVFCREREVVVGKKSAVADGEGLHRGVDVSEVLGIVLLEHRAEVGLAEVAGMLEHDVEDELHSALVDLVDEFLEGDIGIGRGGVFRHIAVVDF